MKLLLITHSPVMNGAQKSLHDLAVNLINNPDLSVTVLCPMIGPLSDALQKAGVPVKFKPLRRPMRSPINVFLFFIQFIPTIIWLRRYLIKEQIDVIYNNTIDALYGPFAAKLAAKPCVWHIREVKPKNKQLRGLFSFLLQKLPTFTLFNSKAIMRAYAERSFPHWHIVYNGIPVNPQLLRTPKMDDKVIVGFVGQMVSHKCPERFVTIFAAAQRSISNLHGIMAGDGVLLDEVKQKVKGLGLHHKLDVLGRVDAISDLYKQMDILVLTSAYEPFGRVLIEAMSVGCAVVAANVDGVPEVVIDKECGFLVPYDDIEAYVKYVLQLAQDRKLRIKMGKRGHARVVNEFTLEKYCQRITMFLQNAATETEN